VAVGLVAVSPAGAASPAFSATVEDDTLTDTARGFANFIALRLATGNPDVLEVDFGENGSKSAG
jgi:hypothetical protein